MPKFPLKSLVHTTNGEARLGRIVDITLRNNLPSYLTLADINTGENFHRVENEVTTILSSQIVDYRLETPKEGVLSPNQSTPWDLQIDSTQFGLYLTFDHPTQGRLHLAVEIDRGAVLVQPTRDPEIAPDLALRITRDGTSIEQVSTPIGAATSHQLFRPNKLTETRPGPTPPSLD